MVSTIPSYVYSLFAALMVGVIVVCTCNVAALNIRVDADRQQLRNIADYVAAQSLTLLSHGNEYQNVTQVLDVPSQVGNQRFWIRIQNDSQSAYVEAGFGVDALSSDLHVNIPASVAAEGTYISGSGHPQLICRFENQTASLTLTQE